MTAETTGFELFIDDHVRLKTCFVANMLKRGKRIVKIEFAADPASSCDRQCDGRSLLGGDDKNYAEQ
jgi:hypothetical protein